jgi:hypothetical protein
MATRRDLFFGVCALIVIVVSTASLVREVCLSTRPQPSVSRHEETEDVYGPGDTECKVHESPQEREDIREMLRFAKLIDKRSPWDIHAIVNNYDSDFELSVFESQGKPGFYWVVQYHFLDPDGDELRSYVKSRSCVWRLEPTYVGFMAQIRVSPRTLEEVKDC